MSNPIRRTSNRLNILFIASEADPLVKVGGLGDVSFSLPNAILELNPEETGGKQIDIRLVLPYHSVIREKSLDVKKVAEFPVAHIHGEFTAEVYETRLNQVTIYLVAGDPIPPGAAVYSGDDHADGMKYVFFSLAALELPHILKWCPDIIHANDWHTAITVHALALQRKTDPFFKHTRSILTVHNLPFMGSGAQKEVEDFLVPPVRSKDLPPWARTIPLTMGLYSADEIVMVSPGYAREVLTPEFGCGLQEFFQKRGERLTGIINGLDMDAWDPQTDPHIRKNYSVDDLPQRTQNKTALLEEFNLSSNPSIPLIILISRMDPQKGVDLAIEALRQADDLPWQAILLGSGFSKLEDDARQLEADFPERVRAAIRFDAKLSRRMYSGADILLMPSIYEPCGLAQMIAMRYGCVPVARATGGLKDTIVDIRENENGNGFLFEHASGSELSCTLRQALIYYKNREIWQKIQITGMNQDFSWKKSALAYVRLYQKLRGR